MPSELTAIDVTPTVALAMKSVFPSEDIDIDTGLLMVANGDPDNAVKTPVKESIEKAETLLEA